MQLTGSALTITPDGPQSPPTEYELSMAMLWTVLNACRLFHGVEPDDVTEAERRFLGKWRAIPIARRQAALDFEFPVRTEADREAEERAARIAKMREVLNGEGGKR